MGIQNFFVNEKAILEIMDLREIEDVAKKNPPNAPNIVPTISIK